MKTQIDKLSNGIDFAYRQNKNTPRPTFCINFSICKDEKSMGIYAVMTQLLMQGTKNRSAEEIARELDLYAIDFSVDTKLDFLSFKFTCLNEDFSKALEIASDIILNSTFKEFEKEVQKLKGEITAKLDSPKAKITDAYYAKMFENHPYGHVSSKVLENLDNITKENVIDAYNTIIKTSKKVCSFVGDIEFEIVKNSLEKELSNIPISCEPESERPIPTLDEKKYTEVIKADANQAHILKGWITPTHSVQEYPALVLLNIILGSSGLSSRLFLELREKKGLAYVVRSQFEPLALCGNFSIYIATEPKNIQTSLDGFEEEIRKIKEIKVSEEELSNAKNNLIGKWEFLLETNAQQASSLASYGVYGLGWDYLEKLRERIEKVTPDDIMNAANKFFGEKSVTAILKP